MMPLNGLRHLQSIWSQQEAQGFTRTFFSRMRRNDDISAMRVGSALRDRLARGHYGTL
jgi:hypothetical protein